MTDTEQVIKAAEKLPGWEIITDKELFPEIHFIAAPNDCIVREPDDVSLHQLLMLAICKRKGWRLDYTIDGYARFQTAVMAGTEYTDWMPEADLAMSVIKKFNEEG